MYIIIGIEHKFFFSEMEIRDLYKYIKTKRGSTIRFVLPSVSMTLTVNIIHLHTRYYCSVNIHTHIGRT